VLLGVDTPFNPQSFQSLGWLGLPRLHVSHCQHIELLRIGLKRRLLLNERDIFMSEPPVAGVDVSKNFSDICIISPDNSIFQTLHISHDILNMQRSLIALRAAERKFHIKPIIVMESTAHYHRILAQFLQNSGYEVLVINPMQSGALRNINIRKVKNDKTLHNTNQPNEILANIRDYCRQRADLVSTQTAYISRLTSLLDQAFPGYRKIFSHCAAKSSLAILSSYPTPTNILNADLDELSLIIGTAAKKKPNNSFVQGKIKLLLQVAAEAVQINIKLEAYGVIITSIAALLIALNLQIEALQKQALALLKQNPQIDLEIALIRSISGIGLYSAAFLRAEIGNFSIFGKPKQLVAFFGMDPSTRQSGKFIGTQTKLSKRGSPYARAILDICVQTAIHPHKGKQPANPVLLC